MRKILLINPPVSIYVNKTAFLPLPLLVLGACLKEIPGSGSEFSHELIDLDYLLKSGALSDDSSFYPKAGDLILAREPDVLLFTVHGLNHVVVLKLAARIKRERPSCIIVVGGVGPTLTAGHALEKCPEIDMIVKGEGETALGSLIPAILQGRDISHVPSLAYRQDGKVKENARVYLGKDSPIPSPDYSLVRIEDYTAHNRLNPYVHPGFVPIESGRGCPFNCTFCAPAKMWERNVRYRPVPEIIEEMKYLAARGGNFTFLTQDNLEEGFLRTFSEALIEGNVGIQWGCYSRLDRLPDGMAQLLSRAGCRLIFTGFETPNKGAQKSIRKVVNSSAAFQKLYSLNSNGIQLIGSFIAGFPEETDDDLANTMRFALECAAGMEMEQLAAFIKSAGSGRLPQKGANICLIHPLSYMPGTDSFEQEKGSLHISDYALHPDCYGSYLFSHEEFKDDWTFLGGNPYLNHLPEEKVRYYCSILRLYNFLNSRPFYFAQLLATLGEGPLELVKKMVASLGEEFVLSAKIEAFELQSREYIGRHLEYTPEWTVKKGQ